MELEALESLFPTELVRYPTKFELVGLVPHSDNSEVNHVSVDISFSFPLDYPSTQTVDWSIIKSTGFISTDSSRLEDLEASIRSVCEDNLGCCVVYQIADRIQEWLRENNEEEKSLHDMLLANGTNEVNQSRRKVVRFTDEADEDYDEEADSDYSDYSDEEDGSFDSDSSDEEEQFEELQMKDLCPEEQRVTRDQFVEWKREYDDYLLGCGIVKRIGADDTRATGKQQFLELITKRRNENQTEQEFNAELFGNEDDLDEDDLE